MVSLARPTLTKIEAITLVSHLKFKFPIPTGVGEVEGDSETARICYSQALVMAETYQDNKRKATLFQKQHSGKKHRTYQKKGFRKEVQIIESLQGNSNPCQINISPILRTTNPDSDLKESNHRMTDIQAQTYIEKNSDARVQQLVSSKDLAKVEPAVETEVVLIDENNPSKKVKIGVGLETFFKKELTKLLREYADVFA